MEVLFPHYRGHVDVNGLDMDYVRIFSHSSLVSSSLVLFSVVVDLAQY